MNKPTTGLVRRLSGMALLLCLSGTLHAQPVTPPRNPAVIQIAVAPERVAPGGETTVTVTLEPIEKVKIARYPQIKLQVPAQPGLVMAAETAIGDAEPPAPEHLEHNYWGKVDAVVLTLQVDPAAKSGRQEVEAKLRYNYCVSGSFCAPARVPVKFTIDVE
jgi:hypothetical protein